MESELKQGSQAWLDARKGRLTASVIGRVITGNGRDGVLRDMVRDALGYPKSFQGNVATQWGNDNEDVARTEYALTTGNAVRETGLHIHPEHEWMAASPDGLVGSDGLLELKCPYGLRNADEVPQERVELTDRDLYWHQMQCQMHVMGRDWCDFVVWCPTDMKVKRYHRDDHWVGWALDTCQPFLAYLRDVLADDDEAERVADVERAMDDDQEWAGLAEDYRNIDAKIKRLKEEQDRVKGLLIEKAAERKATGAGISVIPVTRQGGVDYKAMSKAAGVNPDDFRKPASTSWQVRLSKGDDE